MTMNKIKCHLCACIQSSARDICIECAQPMSRDEKYILDPDGNPLNHPAKAPLLTPNKTLPPVVEDDPNEMEFNVICCHKCFFVQLEGNIVCSKCNTVMERNPTFIFSSKKIPTQKRQQILHPDTANNLSPEALIAEYQAKNINIEKSANEVHEDFSSAKTVKINSLGLHSAELAPKAKTQEPIQANSPKAEFMNICCNKCFLVQNAQNKICEKCANIMDRDPVYIFAKKHI